LAVGLTLQVGSAAQVLHRDAAQQLERALLAELGYLMPSGLLFGAWSGREIAASWVGILQQEAKRQGSFPHLDACDAWSTVYLQHDGAPAVVEYGFSDGKMRVEGSGPFAEHLRALAEERNKSAVPGPMRIICGSLPSLRRELDDLVGKILVPNGVECYSAFQKAAIVAEKRRRPLWVIK